MKEKPHATPVKFDASRYDTARFDTTRLDAKPVIAGQGDLRTVILPAVGAITLVVLFFVLLLSTPSTQPTPEPAVEIAADTPSVAPAEVVSPVVASCEIPQVEGKAGIIGTRFRGQKTSSGHRFEPTEPTCIVNAAGRLAELAYGTEVRLARADGQPQTSVCQVIGRWNGDAHSDRILLISGKVADELQFGHNGLLDVSTDCPSQTTASREAVQGDSRVGAESQTSRAAKL